LGSLEDPEGCRHGGYYIKVGKVPIKKSTAKQTTTVDFGDNRISNWSQQNIKSTPWRSSWGDTIQTHHGAMLQDVAMFAVLQCTLLYEM
jgi:hypothetical protein